MIQKTTAIILNIRKHTDRFNVLTVFSRHHGRLVFLSPAGSGKSARLAQSRLQPLSVIDIEFNHKQDFELQKLRSFSLHNVWGEIYFNPLKQAITIFLSEFLYKFLNASQPDEKIWNFIYYSLSYFDSLQSHISDFHIIFLVSLIRFSGIMPDIDNYSPGDFFDMRSGSFTDFPPLHSDCLQKDETAFAVKLMRLNYSTMHILRLNGGARLSIIENILKYYAIHFPGTSNLKSLPILHTLFHT